MSPIHPRPHCTPAPVPKSLDISDISYAAAASSLPRPLHHGLTGPLTVPISHLLWGHALLLA
jgi:hypothetical protein